MKFYVYIIQSSLDNSYYKGFSLDPYSRLEQHNLGESSYTSNKIPWKLVCILSFETKKEALILVPTKCREREKIKKILHSKFGCPYQFYSKFTKLNQYKLLTFSWLECRSVPYTL